MAKIMIVDDNKDISETIKMIIGREDNIIMIAANGEEFLTKVNDFSPDLVLLDVMMPGLNTRQIMEKLSERNVKLKIILVTVVRFSASEKAELMKNQMIVDYINKPFNVTDLIGKVNKHLQKSA